MVRCAEELPFGNLRTGLVARAKEARQAGEEVLVNGDEASPPVPPVRVTYVYLGLGGVMLPCPLIMPC